MRLGWARRCRPGASDPFARVCEAPGTGSLAATAFAIFDGYWHRSEAKGLSNLVGHEALVTFGDLLRVAAHGDEHRRRDAGLRHVVNARRFAALRRRRAGLEHLFEETV